MFVLEFCNLFLRNRIIKNAKVNNFLFFYFFYKLLMKLDANYSAEIHKTVARSTVWMRLLKIQSVF